MKADKFYHRINKQSNKLIRSIKAVNRSYDGDTIHDLRTIYKKLRALFRWQKINKKKYSSLKKIYAASGEIRNLQVTQKRIKNPGDLAGFSYWLDTSLLNFKAEWQKTGTHKQLTVFRKNIQHLKIKPSLHKNFIRKKIKLILRILNLAEISNELIHNIRKAVKDIQYIYEYLFQIEKRKNVAAKLSRLKAISNKIGEYIDLVTAVNLFDTYIAQEKEELLLIKASVVKEQLNKRCADEKNKILKGLSSYNVAKLPL